MRVMVTNDDGVWAPGIGALARAVVEAGYDVIVIAPLEDRSGSSAALGPVHLNSSLALEKVELPGLDGVPCYGIDGPPAVAVMTARLGGFGAEPDVVVSGINPGPNTGRSVLHSGTVGAALAAANFGVSGLAVSLGSSDPFHWDTAASLAVEALDWLVDAPRKTVLNLNVPGCPLHEVKGVRFARLAPFGTVRTAVAEASDARLELELRDTGERLDPDTDTALVNQGWAALTPLVGVRAAEGIDPAPAIGARLAALVGERVAR
jgi:5'-nucleotidase